MKRLILSCAFLCAALVSFAGGRIVTEKVRSELLKAEKVYSVYLPEGYETSGKNYPVLYLLHGAWGSHRAWIEEGNVQWMADRLVREGFSSEMIIVMPDASGQRPDFAGKNMGYFNVPEWPYEDFFFQEFIPYLEKTYRIRADKEHRAIAGLSMGGGGAVAYAQRHPEMFGTVCSLSGLLGNFEGDDWMTVYPGMEDFARTTVAANPVDFLRNATPGQLDALRTIRWYADCGDDDSLYLGNVNFYLLMREKNIPLQFRMRDGGHTWKYWKSALPAVLQYVSIGFASL